MVDVRFMGLDEKVVEQEAARLQQDSARFYDYYIFNDKLIWTQWERPSAGQSSI